MPSQFSNTSAVSLRSGLSNIIPKVHIYHLPQCVYIWESSIDVTVIWPYLIWVVHNPVASVPLSRATREIKAAIQEDVTWWWKESRVRHLQARDSKACEQPAEAGERQPSTLPEALRGNTALLTLWFQTPSLCCAKRINLWCFQPVCGSLLRQSSEGTLLSPSATIVGSAQHPAWPLMCGLRSLSKLTPNDFPLPLIKTRTRGASWTPGTLLPLPLYSPSTQVISSRSCCSSPNTPGVVPY